MWLTDNFREALEDYFYLTTRGYPERGFLKLVGDRYKLTEHQRTILYRGVASAEKAESRRARLCLIAELQNQEIFIDGLNVLLTLTAYLQGLPLFVALDGFLRDAASFRGKFPKTELIEKSFELLLEFLPLTGQPKTGFYLDVGAENIYNWNRIFENVNPKNCPNLELIFCPKTDNVLINKQSGIICTSDTGIIDQTACRCFDLPRHVLLHFFKPQFADLTIHLRKK